VNLEGLSAAELERLAAAAEAVLDCHRVLAKTGHNVVGEVLRGEGEFVEWTHYPADDAYDPETHCQYYYHAHPAGDRAAPEHGHFHLFVRPKGMPAGVRPAPGQTLPPGDNDALSHVIAISMDAYGRPMRLFATNRWVTGETWYAAPDVVRLADAFRIDIARPNLVVGRWLTALVALYRREIAGLLAERDARIADWRRDHPELDVFEDRRLEIAAIRDISIEDNIVGVAGAIGRTGGVTAALQNKP
jgi:hypothetical protein